MAQINNTMSFPGPTGETLDVLLGTYPQSGQLHVQIVESGEPYCTLSVAGHTTPQLAPGEFLAKTWYENEDVATAALKSGLFTDTGRRIPIGHEEAQVWRINQ